MLTTTFRVIDRATSTLNKISKGFKGVGTSAEKTAKSATKSYMDMMRQMNNVKPPAKLFSGIKENISGAVSKLPGMSNLINGMSGGAGALLSKFKAILVTIGAIVAMKKGMSWLLDQSDSLSSINARLANMNDGTMTQVQLQDRIMQAANDSRASFLEMADSVAKFGANAQGAFKNTEEVVKFGELLNKQYVIAGTNAQGAAAANLQISQALSMGVLRGQEFNSVLEHASPVADALAKELNVSRGELKGIAEQGLITADVLKNAMLNSADEINAKFNQMPMTLGQIKTQLQTEAVKAFRPVLAIITQVLNSPAGKAAIQTIIRMLHMLANVVLVVARIFQAAINFIHKHWEKIRAVLIAIGIVLATVLAPIILGVIKAIIAALAAALSAAAPFIAAIALIAFAIYQIGQHWDLIKEKGIEFFATIGEIIIAFASLVGNIIGVIIAVVLNALKLIWNAVVFYITLCIQRWYDMKYAVEMVAYGIKSAMQSAANFVTNVINSAIGKVEDLVNSAISGLNKLINLANNVPGINISTIGEVSLSRVSAPQIFGDLTPPTRQISDFYDNHSMDYTDVGAAGQAGADIGAAVGQGFVDLVSNAATTVGDKAGELKDSVTGAFNDLKEGALKDYDALEGAGADGFNQTDPSGDTDTGGGGGSGGGPGSPARTLKDIEKNTRETAENTGGSDAQLKLLTELTRQRAIVNATVGGIKNDIKVTIGDIYDKADIDGIGSELVTSIENALATTASGRGEIDVIQQSTV